MVDLPGREVVGPVSASVAGCRWPRRNHVFRVRPPGRQPSGADALQV